MYKCIKTLDYRYGKKVVDDDDDDNRQWRSKTIIRATGKASDIVCLENCPNKETVNQVCYKSSGSYM